jgi:hypothetical protein
MNGNKTQPPPGSTNQVSHILATGRGGRLLPIGSYDFSGKDLFSRCINYRAAG